MGALMEPQNHIKNEAVGKTETKRRTFQTQESGTAVMESFVHFTIAIQSSTQHRI